MMEIVTIQENKSMIKKQFAVFINGNTCIEAYLQTNIN